jgi:hypothetical protein
VSSVTVCLALSVTALDARRHVIQPCYARKGNLAMCANVSVYMHAYIYIYVRTCTCVYKYNIYIYIYIYCVCIYIHIHICVLYVYTFGLLIHVPCVQIRI